MASRLSMLRSEKLTHAGKFLAEMLRAANRPVLTSFDFHQLVWRMYTQPTEQRLFLRTKTPLASDTSRLRKSLKNNGIIVTDPDYGARAIRVVSVSDLPAEDVICLLDPTIYVSHLSAMQRWGLTDRHPEKLLLTRPDRKTIGERLQTHMAASLRSGEENPFPLRVLAHPPVVRQRAISVLETKAFGAQIQVRGTSVRVSTIGQTFLDMLQNPDLCGGMSHILDVWQEHARTYLDEIVTAVNTAKADISKSRAGYILEEKLGLVHPDITSWKALGQRGGSRKLDPDKPFAPQFSEVWMLSLNV